MPGRKPTLFVEPGQRFGRLTVVDPERRRENPHGSGTQRAALCICECGTEKLVSIYQLLNGKMDSCGCLTRERVYAQYGLSETVSDARYRLYVLHYFVMKRCYEPGHDGYKNHGGRGINVWEPWLDGHRFVEDIERDLGPVVYGMTLDRIDNDGNYEPGNVRWATWAEQKANQRSHPE